MVWVRLLWNDVDVHTSKRFIEFVDAPTERSGVPYGSEQTIDGSPKLVAMRHAGSRCYRKAGLPCGSHSPLGASYRQPHTAGQVPPTRHWSKPVRCFP